ncbi:MAG: hypothetical protein NZ739_03235 [Verrucomicrobiae bacterium]|nr:hypothetical protein [Verrucomicrobiae bacterium]MDW7980121.1 hypothetical protein [Verrucomicrobiales bacterium]
MHTVQLEIRNSKLEIRNKSEVGNSTLATAVATVRDLAVCTLAIAGRTVPQTRLRRRAVPHQASPTWAGVFFLDKCIAHPDRPPCTTLAAGCAASPLKPWTRHICFLAAAAAGIRAERVNARKPKGG